MARWNKGNKKEKGKPGGKGNPNWVKGVSGNPAGRPVGAVTLAEAVRKIVDPIEWATVTWNKAKEGDARCLEILADRGWGKAPLEIILTPQVAKYDLEKLTNEELALFESLVEKMDAKRLGITVIDADSVNASET
jgi:hypothetical protein